MTKRVAFDTTQPVDDLGRLKHYVVLTNFPDVTVSQLFHIGIPEDRARVEYCGFAEDLINAGIANADMLRPKIKGRPRVDLKGDKFTMTSWWTNTPAAPRRRYKLWLRGFADQLPFASDAIAAYQAARGAGMYAASIMDEPVFAVRVPKVTSSPPPTPARRRARPDWLRVVK